MCFLAMSMTRQPSWLHGVGYLLLVIFLAGFAAALACAGVTDFAFDARAAKTWSQPLVNFWLEPV